MENNYKAGQIKQSRYFWAFTAAIAVLLATILLANQWHLTFVLDDPFIHLALAENLLSGHYGVNGNEPSSPASSVLWPFLLAPFTVFAGSAYSALMLNVVFALLAVKVFCDFLAMLSLRYDFAVSSQGMLVFAFVVFANLLSLVFIGMEHALQLWLSLLLSFYLLESVSGRTLDRKIFAVIIVLPLVRYECLALSVPTLFFLWQTGEKKQVLVGAGLLVLLLVAFSFYLKSLGLDYLPSSILLKSNNEASLFDSLARRFGEHLLTPKFYILLVFLALFVKFAFNRVQSKEKRRLAFAIAMAITLFLLFGRFGWYYRYEIFLWAPVWMFALYFFADRFSAVLTFTSLRKRLVLLIVILLVGIEHVVVTVAIPLAANNIYLQQYQMGRFVKEYYQKPVAVNDIGAVAFQNENYVLDLWGLASKEALVYRKSEPDAMWMQKLAAKHDVGLAMLYYSDTGNANGWFEQVPESWIKLGELKMTAMGISVSKREVVFFATDEKAWEELLPLLKKFSTTLPRLSHFEFSE